MRKKLIDTDNTLVTQLVMKSHPKPSRSILTFVTSYAPLLPEFEQTTQLELNNFPKRAQKGTTFDQSRTCVQQKPLQDNYPECMT